MDNLWSREEKKNTPLPLFKHLFKTEKLKTFYSNLSRFRGAITATSINTYFIRKTRSRLCAANDKNYGKPVYLKKRKVFFFSAALNFPLVLIKFINEILS